MYDTLIKGALVTLTMIVGLQFFPIDTITQPTQQKFVLSKGIGCPYACFTDYGPLITALYNAKKDDVIEIELNQNRGGKINVMLEIVEAMRASKALIYTSQVGQASSCAMDILFSGDIVKVNRGYIGLAHMTSDYRDKNDDLIPFFQYFKKFLTRKQFHDFINDADIHLYGKTVCKVGKGTYEGDYCIIYTRTTKNDTVHGV